MIKYIAITIIFLPMFMAFILALYLFLFEKKG